MTRLALTQLKPIVGASQTLPGGKLYFYEAGASTTPKTVYSDSTLVTPLGSEVTADGEGVFTDIYYSGDIRYVLRDKGGVFQYYSDVYGAGNIDTGDLADGAVTTIKIDDAAVTLGKLLTLDNANIITSNGSANSQVAVSGDVTMSNTGVFTIANNAITTAKILDANVTDAKLATGTQTKLGYIRNRQRVVAGLTANVSITGVPVVIDWNYHSYTDLASLHSTSSNPSRFVVPTGATRFNMHIVASTGPTAAQTVSVQIYKNGSASWIGGAKRSFSGQGDKTVLEVTTGWLSCAAADYFQVYVYGASLQELLGNSGADSDESYVVFEVEST